MRLIERQLRIRLSELDQRTHAARLDVPTLVFLDHDDATVDPWPTVEFAQARPDLVRLVETRGAGHCRSWNLDPVAYDQELSSFLASV
jgi:hypothetical protein